MSAIIFDIETGPQPWPDIEQFYTVPDSLPDFDEGAVKLGNTKDPGKVAEKIADARHAHNLAKQNEVAEHALHKQEWIARTPLDPTLGRILAIGYKRDDNVRIDGRSEPDILLRFWEIFRKQVQQHGRMVGHNIFGFDLPFIIRRSWIVGVKAPADVLDKGRYWNQVFIDTMQVWSCGRYGDHSKLDLLARVFGCGAKTDKDECSGADFHKLWCSGDEKQKETAEKYLRNDLTITEAVAVRLGIV